MQKISFFLIIFLFFIFIFLTIKFSFPFIFNKIKEEFGVKIEYELIEFPSHTSIKIKGISISMDNALKIKAGELTIALNIYNINTRFDKKFVKLIELKNVDAEITEELFKKFASEEKSKTLFELPFFPVETINIQNISAKLSISDRNISVKNLSIKGNKDYFLEIPSINYQDNDFFKTPVKTSISLRAFVDGYKYELRNLSVDSPFISINGNTADSSNFFNADFTISGDNVFKLLKEKGTGDISGSLKLFVEERNPVIKGVINASKLNWKFLHFWDVHAALAADKRGFTIDNLVLYNKNNAIAALKGSGKFSEMAISGSVYVYDAELKDILTRVEVTAPVNLKVTGVVDYRFSFEKLSMEYNLRAMVDNFIIKLNRDNNPILKMEEPHLVTGKGNLLIKDGKVTLEKGVIQTKDERTKLLVGDAFFGFGDKFSLKLLDGSFVDPSKFGSVVAGIPMKAGLAAVKGAILPSAYPNPHITAELKCTNCEVLGMSADQADGSYEMKNFKIDVVGKKLKKNSITTIGSKVFVDIAEKFLTFEMNNASGDVADIPKIFGKSIPLSGDFAAYAKGKIRFDATLESLDGTVKTEKIVSGKEKIADSITLNLIDKDDSVLVERTFLKYGDSSLALKGFIKKDFSDSNINLSLDSFFIKDFPFPEKLSFISPKISATISGPVKTPNAKLNLFAGKVSFDDMQFGNLSVAGELNSEKKEARATGNLGDNITLKANIADFDLEKSALTLKINDFINNIGDFKIKVSADAEIKQGNIDAVIHKLYLSRKEFFLKSNSPLIVSGNEKKITINETTFDGEALNFTLKGTIDEGIPHIFARGTLFPRSLSQFYEKHLENMSGNASFDIALNDKFVSGIVMLSDISFLVKAISTPASNISGQIVLQNNKFKTKNISGMFGGGKLGIYGSGEIMPDFKASISSEINNAQSSYKDIGSFAFSSNLALNIAPDEPMEIVGDIDLKNATYRKNINIESDILKKLVKRRSYDSSNTVKKGEKEQFLRLNLNVTGKNNIRIQNNLAQTNINFATNISGYPDSINLSGQATLKDGVIIFKQNNFDIQRGIVTFEADSGIRPYIDIAAGSTVKVKAKNTSEEEDEYKLNLAIFGYPEDIQVQLSSAPYREQTDLFSLLLFGSFPDAGNMNAEGLAVSAVTDMMGISSEIKKNFNLYQFELSPKYNETNNRTDLKIIAVKELYPFLFIEIESNTTDSTDQKAALRYKGKKLDFILDWKNNDKLENDFGGIGFNLKLSHVFE